MIYYRNCPLCGSENPGLYIQTNDFFLSAEPFSLFRCTSCGFVFTQDHPDEENMGPYYASEDYLSHNDSAKGISSALYRFSRNIMLVKKRMIIEEATGLKKGSLLDIGSGTGHFLSEMKKAGWNVKGIEINEKAREYSVSVHGVDVIDPGLMPNLQAGSFDCITMWHVLEHFQNPYKYVSEISRLLKPVGFCIAALPNRGSYDAAYYKKFWAAYDVPRHLWHFSPLTFNLFSEKTGFRIKTIRRLPLDVFYISMLSEKYSGTRLYFLKGFIKGVWFFVLSSINRKKSSSLIYILQKKQK
jgi:SAM-dependent methyltransferase